MGRIYPDLPLKALSIRQPWTWAILNAGKDVENRPWKTKGRGRVCLHASKSAVRTDLAGFHEFLIVAGNPLIGLEVPHDTTFQRGGIVGVCEITDCVTSYDSPWFAGPYGFVLVNPAPVEFIPCNGALGFFEWRKKILKKNEHDENN